MKVQLFPGTTPPVVGRPVAPMGALTLKPFAYQTRPWETLRTEVPNHYDGVGRLVFHTRGGRVTRVARPGGWLRDRIRFLHDGFRRQRLTRPHGGGRPLGWAPALALWLSLLGGRNPAFRVDPDGVHFYWLLRGYNTLRDGRGPARAVSLDANFEGTPYHGGFGLRAATRAGLALPGCTPHEEAGDLAPPAGGVSLWVTGAVLVQVLRPGRPHRGVPVGGPAEGYPRGPTRGVFQVSPLQGLLGGW